MAWSTPSASCPSVTPGATGSAPATVWTSEVQINACVVRTTTSPGAGSGIGLSTTSVVPTLGMTKAFIVFIWHPSAHLAAVCELPRGIVPWNPRLSKPVLTAVNGPAIAGALELVLSCDINLAVTEHQQPAAVRRERGFDQFGVHPPKPVAVLDDNRAHPRARQQHPLHLRPRPVRPRPDLDLHPHQP